MTSKTRVIFVCTANAARSQMAEGLLRAKYGDRYEVFSAGTKQAKVSTSAIAVMQEIGIDISHHRSKTLDEFRGVSFDIAVTLCDNAHAICPFIPGAKKTIHQGFADPHMIPGSDKTILDGYRRVRDEIAEWIEGEFGRVPQK
ncbi:MAG: low molecular weight phosphatase family protein [Methanomicrobiales archaeon HGW-Methanomicrobiales-1]|nr:MAG: low molecular weight phosphatase family protein [Methanomicrobiales archaeon HGW-Methanomicrobiales-1]